MLIQLPLPSLGGEPIVIDDCPTVASQTRMPVEDMRDARALHLYEVSAGWLSLYLQGYFSQIIVDRWGWRPNYVKVHQKAGHTLVTLSGQFHDCFKVAFYREISARRALGRMVRDIRNGTVHWQPDKYRDSW